MAPAIDRATGRVRPAVRVALGSREYDSLRRSFAHEPVETMMTPLSDPVQPHQSAAIRKLIA